MSQRRDRRRNAQPQTGHASAYSRPNAGRHSRSASFSHDINDGPVKPVSTASHARGNGRRAADPQMQSRKKQNAQGQASYAPASPYDPRQYSRYSTDYSTRKTGMSRKKKKIVTALITALAVSVIGLGIFAYKEYQKSLLDNDLHGGISKEELLAIDAELTGMTTFDEPFTVLLLGSDARSDEPSIGARTDTIVLVRVDPIKNEVSMLSIPRDTRIYIDGVGYDKFNAAYAYGGAKGAIAAAKELCGVQIDHYAEINFEGLVGLIDAIGGIDVVVDETIDDSNAGEIVIPAGEQHLDGAAALVFSRSRAYADGDYTRVSNQRKVIEAIIRRGLEAPANELYGLVRQSASFLTTDSAMNIDFIFSLADQMRHNNEYPITITTATLPSNAQLIGDVSYVIADTKGVKDIIKIFMSGGDIAAFMEEYEASNVGSGDSYSYGSSTGYGSSSNSDYYGYSSGTTSGSDGGYGGGSNSGYGYGSGSTTNDVSNYGTGISSGNGSASGSTGTSGTTGELDTD